MANPKTEIQGTVKKIDCKTNDKGNSMYYLDVLSINERDNGDTESVVYPMKAWRKRECTACASLNLGDFIVAKAAVGAYVNKSGYNTLNLDILSLTVQTNAVPVEDVASAISKEADKAMGQEEPTPF